MSTQVTGGYVPTWTREDRLRKAREHAGLSVRELAERTGISKNTISNYETGKTHRIGRPMLVSWALATGVPLSWLETGETPRQDGPDGGSEECAVRDSNPEPSDYGPTSLRLVA